MLAEFEIVNVDQTYDLSTCFVDFIRNLRKLLVFNGHYELATMSDFLQFFFIKIRELLLAQQRLDDMQDRI